jgi:hypothetical protein
MKTTKFFSVLSLVMIFSGITAVYSKNGPTGNTNSVSKAPIRYVVNIHSLNATYLCNTYLVQLTDENGRLVAPATTFVPGINKYTFFEESPVKGKLRVATLVLSPYTERVVCGTNFTLRPVVKSWPFIGGQTYSFDLYPITIEMIKEGSND